MINRYRVNHYNLNKLLGRKGIIDMERYECGAEKESLNHMLFSCQLYEEERKYMFRKMDKIKKNIDFNIDRMIAEEEWELLELVYKYLKKNSNTNLRREGKEEELSLYFAGSIRKIGRRARERPNSHNNLREG